MTPGGEYPGLRRRVDPGRFQTRSKSPETERGIAEVKPRRCNPRPGRYERSIGHPVFARHAPRPRGSLRLIHANAETHVVLGPGSYPASPVSFAKAAGF